MSQENVELHYRSIDAVNRRDLAAFLALMDRDVEAVPASSPSREVSTGMTESVVGGTTGSKASPTTKLR